MELRLLTNQLLIMDWSEDADRGRGEALGGGGPSMRSYDEQRQST